MFSVKNGIKYLLQGFIIGVAALLVSPNTINYQDAVLIGVVASVTFLFMDVATAHFHEPSQESESESAQMAQMAQIGQTSQVNQMGQLGQMAQTGQFSQVQELEEEEEMLADLRDIPEPLLDEIEVGAGETPAEIDASPNTLGQPAVGVNPTVLGGVPYKLRPGHYSKVIVLPGYNEYVYPANVDRPFYSDRAAFPSKTVTVKAGCPYKD